MDKRKYSVLMILIALMLCASMVLAGCSGQGTAEATAEPAAAATEAPKTEEKAEEPEDAVEPAAEEPIQVSWCFWDMAEIDYEAYINKYCKEKMGIEIIPTSLDWGSWSEQIKLMAASDSLTDLISTYHVSDLIRLNSWIDQGLIRDIPKDMVAENENLQVACESFPALNGFAKVKDDKYWFIPRIDYDASTYTSTQHGIYYRADWAKQFGYDKMDCIDENKVLLSEVKQMYLDFSQKDPDGNGVADTYGLGAHGEITGLNIIWGWWGVDSSGWFLDDDGLYKPGYTNEKLIEVLTWFQDLYKAGAMDPEFTNNDYKATVAKAAVGTVGAFSRQIDFSAYRGNIINTIWESDPERWGHEIVETWRLQVDPWLDDNTAPSLRNINDGGATEVNAKMSDETLRIVLKAFDWLNSQEGKDAKLWGYEGVDFNVVDGKKIPVPKEERPQFAGYRLPGALGTWYSSSQYDKDYAEYLASQYETDKGFPKEKFLQAWKYCYDISQIRNRLYNPDMSNLPISYITTPARSEWTADYGARFTQWVLTDVDIATEFAAYIQELNEKGLQTVIDEVNALV